MNTWPERKSKLPPDAWAVVEASRHERQDSRELRTRLERIKTDLAELIRVSVQEIEFSSGDSPRSSERS